MSNQEQPRIITSKSPDLASQRRQKIIMFLLGLLLGLALWAGLPPLVVQYSVNQLRNYPPVPTVDPANKIDDLMSFLTEADLLAKRSDLISFIWGDAGFPIQTMPDPVETAIPLPDFEDLPNLKEINRLTIKMDWGINSLAYYFIPEQANGKLFIYHNGHEGNLIETKPVIQSLVIQGFAVIALEMPLIGGNNRPVVEIERIGTVELISHNQLKLLQMKAGSPIQLFLTPAAVAVNYAYSLGYSRINMLGISGGGWTTTLVAALDPRVAHSYPVAGSLPMHLRSASGPDWGDYEQTEPGLYRLATYPELYIMGAYGEGRRQVQVINQFDSCCFSGTRFQAYLAPVQERLEQIGPGYFDVYLDSSHQEHKISEDALEVILQDVQNVK